MQKVSARFIIYRACNRLYYYKFVDHNGHTLLKSDGYFHLSKCQSYIILVKQNVIFISRYKCLHSKEGYYFELSTASGKPIVKSSFFPTARERAVQIQSLMHAARFAQVDNTVSDQVL
jgi:uncharacterized protein YegP (UPF0339 family)